MNINPNKTAGRPKRGEAGLELHSIMTAAWQVVERDGLAGLSTRTLAAALGVKSPALYWHVRSKEALLSLMIENLLDESIGEVPPGIAWQDWLKLSARNQRNAFLSHRDSGKIASMAPPTERMRTKLFPASMAPLLNGGLTPKMASSATGVIASFVLGWVLYEQREETRSFIEEFHRSDEAFEFGLDAIVLGLADKTRVTLGEVPTAVSG